MDINGNGRLDTDEPGVAGCLVSDGVQIVATDAAGHYRLEPKGPRSVIFVVNRPGTWPSGRWWTPVGTATKLDFALVQQRQDEPLVFLQGTDIHLQPGAVALYQRYIEHVNALPVQLVIHTGDLVVDALPRDVAEAEKLYELYEKETSALRPALRAVPGNHEHVGAARKDLTGRGGDYDKGMYQRRIGPMTYALRYGRYHFIALDGTSLDGKARSGYRDRLDDASAAWASRYLATVGPDEPILLLVHEPLANRDTDQQLLQALQGKRLLAVLAGHEHSRSVTQWGGAPMIVAGAVSYAWHGIMPFPPDPWGDVIYRLEKDQLEYAYLDWSAERSVNLKSPAWGSLVTTPQMTIDGTVSDLDGRIRRVVCRLGELKSEARLARSGHLVTCFETTLDASRLADGVYDLAIETSDGTRTATHTRPVIVKHGQPQRAAAKPARLKLLAVCEAPEGCEVRLAGQPLGRIGVTKTKGAQQWSIDLPGDRLERLNQITVIPPAQGRLEISRAHIEYDGRSFYDVRFSPTLRRGIVKTNNRAAMDYYIDLEYQGPRALMPTAEKK